jgi:hypothetical protein
MSETRRHSMQEGRFFSRSSLVILFTYFFVNRFIIPIPNLPATIILLAVLALFIVGELKKRGLL